MEEIDWEKALNEFYGPKIAGNKRKRYTYNINIVFIQYVYVTAIAANPKRYIWDMFLAINTTDDYLRSPTNSRNLLGGMASDIWGIVDFFGKPSNQVLMDGLHEIEKQLDGINNQIEELISEVDKSSIQTQYISVQRVIVESIRSFNNYANMVDPMDKAYWLREFNKYGSLVRESTSFLMDGMLGNGFIATDIIAAISRLAKVY